MTLDAIANELLCSMDGSRDQTRLREYLMERMQAGALVIRQANKPLADPDLAREALDQALTQALEKLL